MIYVSQHHTILSKISKNLMLSIWLRVMTWNLRPCTFLVIIRRPGRLRHRVQVKAVKWAKQETWTPDKHWLQLRNTVQRVTQNKIEEGGSSVRMTFISICTIQRTASHECLFFFGLSEHNHIFVGVFLHRPCLAQHYFKTLYKH